MSDAEPVVSACSTWYWFHLRPPSVWLKMMARSGSGLQPLLPNAWLVARRAAVIHVLVVDAMTNFASLSKLWLDDSAGPLVTHFSLP